MVHLSKVWQTSIKEAMRSFDSRLICNLAVIANASNPNNIRQYSLAWWSANAVTSSENDSVHEGDGLGLQEADQAT